MSDSHPEERTERPRFARGASASRAAGHAESGACSSPRERHRFSFLLLVLSAAISTPASAEPFQALELRNVSGFVELEASSRRDERSFDATDVETQRDELELSERLRLNLAGSVYHPRLLEYHLSGDVELVQEFVHEGDDVLTGGSWHLLFLKEHPYNFSLFGDVSQNEVDRAFFRPYQQDSRVYGAAFRLGKGPLPFELSYTHRDIKRSGTRSDFDELSDELWARARYEVGEWSRGDLSYRATNEEIREQEVLRHRLSANNTTYFDADRRKKLAATLYVEDQENDRGLDRFTLSSFGSFSWRHSDVLSTEYRLGYQSDDNDIQNSTHWNAEASLRHQLYESLTSTVDAYGRFQDGSYGTMRHYGIRVNENYSKRLGRWGRLDINLVPFVDTTQNRPRQTTAMAVRERSVMQGSLPVELVQRNVDPSTIVVTDETGSIIYVEGLDYSVTVNGEATELTRIVTGAIADPESVRVDYVYRLTGPSDLRSLGANLELNLSFREWMALYGKLHWSDEQVLSGDPGRELDARDRELFGARLTRGWLTARTEIERERSPYRTSLAFSQHLSLATPRQYRWRARLASTHRYQSFDEIDRDLTRLTAAALVEIEIERRGLLTLAADFQRERWGGDAEAGFVDLDAFGAKASFTWRFRRTHLTAEASISRIDRGGQVEDLKRLLLRVRREF